MPAQTLTADRGPNVVAVLVTHRRPGQLAESLRDVLGQGRPPDLVLVVDNGDDAATEALVDRLGPLVERIPSRRNLGGAGGFALAALTALARGADWVWFADDDGRPADDRCLQQLLDCAGRTGWQVVAPLVVDLESRDRLAFPLRVGRTWLRHTDEAAARELVPGRANLFNGTLAGAAALMAFGVPDLRLFVRGDEVDVHRRLVRSGLPFGTCTAARYLHPGGQHEWQPLAGGRLRVLVPEPGTKQDRTFRNLGYLTSLPGLRWRAGPDLLRYAWYFGSRRDATGWRRWWRLWREGRAERFGG